MVSRPSRANFRTEINPMQEKNLKYYFQKCTPFLCLKLQPKQNLFLKGHWENFEIWGVTKQTKIYFINKQLFFLCYVLGKIKLN